jgi:hypothetical protein
MELKSTMSKQEEINMLVRIEMIDFSGGLFYRLAQFVFVKEKIVTRVFLCILFVVTFVMAHIHNFNSEKLLFFGYIWLAFVALAIFGGISKAYVHWKLSKVFYIVEYEFEETMTITEFRIALKDLGYGWANY